MNDTIVNKTSVLEKITDCDAVIVQHQIEGPEVQMMINLPNREIRIITLSIPEKDCTVNDLLNEV